MNDRISTKSNLVLWDMQNYSRKTPSDWIAQEFLWEEWQKTKEEIEAGKAKMFGENNKENILATN